ncbi:MAG: hypothetical protein AVDCRST_MAG61-2683, partial [uncultured Friedmanniella sp.]
CSGSSSSSSSRWPGWPCWSATPCGWRTRPPTCSASSGSSPTGRQSWRSCWLRSRARSRLSPTSFPSGGPPASP